MHHCIPSWALAPCGPDSDPHGARAHDLKCVGLAHARPYCGGRGGGGAIIRELRHFGEMACPAPSGNGDKRPYTCECCLEYNSTFEDVVHSHPAECKCFLLPCPNKCTSSESGIQRQYLDQHVKNECLLTVVQCKLHNAGCEVTLPRKDMTDHMKKDSIAHISLLAARNHRLSKQLGEKDARTKQELMYKEEQICLLTQVNTELEENTTDQLQDLRENVVSQSQELTRTKQKLFRTKQGCLIVLTVAILLVAILLVYHVLQQLNLQELRIHVEILQTQQQHDLQELRTDVEILQIQLKCDLQDLGMDVDILQTQKVRDLKELRTDVAMLQTQNECDLKELRMDVAMLETQNERDRKERRTDVAKLQTKLKEFQTQLRENVEFLLYKITLKKSWRSYIFGQHKN